MHRLRAYRMLRKPQSLASRTSRPPVLPVESRKRETTSGHSSERDAASVGCRSRAFAGAFAVAFGSQLVERGGQHGAARTIAVAVRRDVLDQRPQRVALLERALDRLAQ